jgi:NADP-dependent 3-hydroxy acid dehydrogenase YdfG
LARLRGWRGVVHHVAARLANLYAPPELTRQCLPLMLERNRGAIVNVSSLVGEAPLPNTASYATTREAYDAAGQVVVKDIDETLLDR